MKIIDKLLKLVFFPIKQPFGDFVFFQECFPMLCSDSSTYRILARPKIGETKKLVASHMGRGIRRQRKWPSIQCGLRCQRKWPNIWNVGLDARGSCLVYGT